MPPYQLTTRSAGAEFPEGQEGLMAQMSDYLEGQLRMHLFRSGTFSKPSELWISLHGIWDAATGGHLLCYGALTNSLNVVSGGPPVRFAVGALDVVFQ